MVRAKSNCSHPPDAVVVAAWVESSFIRVSLEGASTFADSGSKSQLKRRVLLPLAVGCSGPIRAANANPGAIAANGGGSDLDDADVEEIARKVGLDVKEVRGLVGQELPASQCASARVAPLPRGD
jgi:hypothetical protein